jgi:hypothetical protein
MGYQLSPLFLGQIAGGAIFFAGLGIYTAYEKVDTRMNYTSVAAKIVETKTECAPVDGHQDYHGKIVFGPCGSYANMSDTQLRDWKMIRGLSVIFQYTSPADGRVHKGEFLGSKNDQYTAEADKIFIGKPGTILAHDDDAEEYRVESFSFKSPS